MSKHDAPPPRPLSPRQLQVAFLVAQGRDNQQIAAELGLAPRTINNIISAIYAILGETIDGTGEYSVRRARLVLWVQRHYPSEAPGCPETSDNVECEG